MYKKNISGGIVSGIGVVKNTILDISIWKSEIISNDLYSRYGVDFI